MNDSGKGPGLALAQASNEQLVGHMIRAPLSLESMRYSEGDDEGISRQKGEAGWAGRPRGAD